MRNAVFPPNLSGKRDSLSEGLERQVVGAISKALRISSAAVLECFAAVGSHFLAVVVVVATA
jgi:hypothetical protein